MLGRDAVTVNQLFAKELARTGEFSLANHPSFPAAKQQFGFLSGKSTHVNRLEIIRDTHQKMDEFIDPHTADGIKVALDLHEKNSPMLVLETALPIKFAQTIFEATGLVPPCPAVFADLESLPQYVDELPPDVSVLKAFIVSTLNKNTVA